MPPPGLTVFFPAHKDSATIAILNHAMRASDVERVVHAVKSFV